MTEPEPIVARVCQLLDDAGLGVYSPTTALPADTAWPIAVSGWPGKFTSAIVLTTYAGAPEPDSWGGWEFPRLQVRIRHADPLEAQRRERELWRALQFTTNGPGPRDIGGWWLQDCTALQSEAEPLGRDENGLWEYVRNYQLEAIPTP